MKKIFVLLTMIFIFPSIIYAVSVNEGEPINVYVDSAGEIKEITFGVVLAPSESVSIDLVNKEEQNWFPYITFPIERTANEEGEEINISLVLKVPESYTENNKVIEFLADSNQVDETFIINISIGTPASYVDIFDDWLTPSDILHLGTFSDLKIPSGGISQEQIWLELTNCDNNNLIISKGSSKITYCSGRLINISYTDSFSITKARIKIVSTSEFDVNIEQRELGNIEIRKLSSICPSKLSIIKVVDIYGSPVKGTVIITDSMNDAIDTVTLNSGYAKFIVPETENDFITIQVDPEIGDSYIEILTISSSCSKKLSANKTDELVPLEIYLTNDHITIPLEESKACIGVFSKDSVTKNGVKDSLIFAIGSDVVTATTGVGGYTNLCFSKEGTYQIHSEAENYIASEQKTLVVEKEPEPPPKPKVSFTLLIDGNSASDRVYYGENVTIQLVNKENNDRYMYNGFINMVINDKTIPLKFIDGISNIKVDEIGEYTLLLSEITEFESENKKFYVIERPVDFSIFYAIIVIIVIVIILILIIKKAKSGVRNVGFGSPEESETFLSTS